MGAYFFAVQSSRLFGWVLDLTDDSPLPDALVRTSLGQETTSDEDGFWEIASPLTGQFRITASKQFYNTITTEVLRLQIEDTLDVTIRLPHPEFSLSQDTVLIRTLPNMNPRTQMAVRNPGNGPLQFTLEKRIVGDDVVNPWGLRRSLAAGQLADDHQLRGVIFTGDSFYVSETNEGGSPRIYVLDREGRMARSFNQVGEARLGMRDLAWDGSLIWGSGERMVYSFDLSGNRISSFSGPYYPNTAIAWDSDRSALWMCGTVSDSIAGYNREGQSLARLSRVNIANIFGLAYYPADPDGCPLYVLSNPSGERHLVSKINPANNQIIQVCELTPPAGGRPEGAFVSNAYDPLSWVFIEVVSNTPENGGDRVDIYQLSARSEWITVTPLEGEVTQGLQFLVTIELNSRDLQPNTYRCELHFSHNARGEEAVALVEMEVLDPRETPEPETAVPTDFILHQPYPNPFNSSLNLTYELPHWSQVKITLFDQSGRLYTT